VRHGNTDIDRLSCAEARPSVKPVIALEFIDLHPLAIVARCQRHSRGARLASVPSGWAVECLRTAEWKGYFVWVAQVAGGCKGTFRVR
jgi:hypothetical protein